MSINSRKSSVLSSRTEGADDEMAGCPADKGVSMGWKCPADDDVAGNDDGFGVSVAGMVVEAGGFKRRSIMMAWFCCIVSRQSLSKPSTSGSTAASIKAND